MQCQHCGYGLETQGNFCGQCRQPTLGIGTPRDVKLRQSFGVASKIVLFCLLYLTVWAVFIYFIAGPLAVKSYGSSADAKIVGALSIEQGRGVTYVVDVAFTDGRGNARIGRADSTRAEFLKQPLGQALSIRYFDGYPYIGRAGPDDVFDEGLSILFLVLAVSLPAYVVKQLNARKRLLGAGNLHSAVMTNFQGHNTRYIEIEYGESLKTVRKFIFRGGKPPKIGSKLWILEDGTEKGIAILDKFYEWECVH